jgi:N-acetylneuraminic acid mutarotase
MLIWGGADELGGYFADGALYHPGTDAWTPLPAGILTGRSFHSTVWTGSEMIVWGGVADSALNDGARYGTPMKPALTRWTLVQPAGAPSPRHSPAVVWTGSEMIVWGGSNGDSYLADGARYNPLTDTWTPLPAAGAPSARAFHSAVWTGSEMFVWGGFSDGEFLNDGARYNPASNTWTSIAESELAGRMGAGAVWTGSEVVLWGGSDNDAAFGDGARYEPSSNTWEPLATTLRPAPRTDFSTVWTGSEMIVWGGISDPDSGEYLNDGASYNPVSDTWIPLPAAGAPKPRVGHTTIWTGSEMIVWGGINPFEDSTVLMDGARYNPASNTWKALPTSGAPTGRFWHIAVWTGSEMIVWGGGQERLLGDGGRYNPRTENWALIPASGAPAARYYPGVVWTGKEMIVWGGEGPVGPFGDGARYAPYYYMSLPLVVH